MPQPFSVVVWPYSLGSKDKLQDGPEGTPFVMAEGTILIWIDFQPGYRYVHQTQYLLASPEKVQSITGSWWPVLNGERIILGDKTLDLRYAEVYVAGMDVRVHPYQVPLSPHDKLQDGSAGNTIRIEEGGTLLIWVDQDANAKFAHKTSYILMAPSKKVTVIDGDWWPRINGLSPFIDSPESFRVLAPYLV